MSTITNKRFKRSEPIEKMIEFAEFLTYNIPPGPNCLPQQWYVNLHKGGIVVYLFSMMVYYDNWSLGAWLYFAMHGSYGICWLLKDFVFPDPSWRKKCTIVSWLLPWPIAMVPYMLPGYWMMSRQGTETVQNPSGERMFISLILYIFGLVFVMLTDAQKYLVLKERKGLITHSMMGNSRNMNYLGEMMLYAAFGVLVGRWETWLIYSYMWGIVFMIRMTIKDYSLSKK